LSDVYVKFKPHSTSSVVAAAAEVEAWTADDDLLQIESSLQEFTFSLLQGAGAFPAIAGPAATAGDAGRLTVSISRSAWAIHPFDQGNDTAPPIGVLMAPGTRFAWLFFCRSAFHPRYITARPGGHGRVPAK
jgi:hypothetical protein